MSKNSEPPCSLVLVLIALELSMARLHTLSTRVGLASLALHVLIRTSVNFVQDLIALIPGTEHKLGVSSDSLCLVELGELHNGIYTNNLEYLFLIGLGMAVWTLELVAFELLSDQ